jgi:hypothetical protein
VAQIDTTVDLVMQRMNEARTQYHRLVLLVGSAGSGKTSVLRAVQSGVASPICNLGIALSGRLLELSEKERSMGLSRLMAEAIDLSPSDVVLLDNIELLFEPKLKANPLELLKALSKTRTVIASWPGHVEGTHLVYANLRHPEYRRYDIDGVAIVEMSS